MVPISQGIGKVASDIVFAINPAVSCTWAGLTNQGLIDPCAANKIASVSVCTSISYCNICSSRICIAFTNVDSIFSCCCYSASACNFFSNSAALLSRTRNSLHTISVWFTKIFDKLAAQALAPEIRFFISFSVDSSKVPNRTLLTFPIAENHAQRSRCCLGCSCPLISSNTLSISWLQSFIC